jgi:peptidoglycan/xylan/chitin deacetylase (PgdA/CDA1 family)
MSALTLFLGAAAPRTAARLFPDLLWRRNDGSRTLYLTFDDGPDEATPALLDLLARHDVPAAFFLLGAPSRRRPDLVRAIRDAGHVVGQHTDTHPDPWKTPAAAVAAEMERATATLEDVTGEAVRWMRPPYGHFTFAMRAWCRARGQRIAMWDVMPGDFLSSATSEVIFQRVVGAVRPGSVIVLHEGGHARSVTPTALARALPFLQADGYRFASLDHAAPEQAVLEHAPA